MNIGFVTIGMAPRDDLLGVFRNRLGDKHELRLVGALDGLSRADVADLVPGASEEALVTQAHHGQPVTIARERISGKMQQRIGELEQGGADLIVVLCTGPFPELNAGVPLLFPDLVLQHFVRGVLPSGDLGVIAPLVSQQPMMRQKWRDYATIRMDAVDPYGQEIAVPDLADFGSCGMIVLDCMGYTPRIRSAVREQTGKPVILAQDVLAHAVEILVGE